MTSRVLIYLLRRDLRVSDNPILHHLETNDHDFTHFLPVYVYPAHQIEISGFLRDGEAKSPYPEARSRVAGYWRAGPHRVKFLAQSVWDLRKNLEDVGSGLEMRVGMMADVVESLLREKNMEVGAVWMTGEDAVEERQEENAVDTVCQQHHVDFKLWQDEKYFIDEYETWPRFQPLSTNKVAVAISPCPNRRNFQTSSPRSGRAKNLFARDPDQHCLDRQSRRCLRSLAPTRYHHSRNRLRCPPPSTKSKQGY